MQTTQGWKGSEIEHKWERLGVKPGIGIRLARDLSTWAKKEKDAASSKSSLPPGPPLLPVPEKPIQIQRPARISYVLEKLAKKSRLALAQDETECSQETEEKEEDFNERDEFETEDEEASVEEVKENVEVDDDETESESDDLEELT